jgi:carboxypeptidase PM20D1
MKRILTIVVLAFLALAAVLVGRAAVLRPPADAVAPAPPIALSDEAAIIERFAAALRIPTISHQDPAQDDPAVFAAFREHLERSYPALHATLRRELVGERSLIYTWEGRDPSKPAVVLMAHEDVVPVEPGTETSWEQPPFSGAVAGGFVWGRGAIDTKSKLTGICEAVELLVRQGFRPARTVLLVFGHDEEVGGRHGASVVADRFRAEGRRFEWVLDEGGTVGIGLIPGVEKPVALVGIAEKGYVTLSVTATAAPGHSSMPPPHTAIGTLAAAIERIEGHPMPAALRGATLRFLRSIAPEMTLPMRIAVANTDVLEPLVVAALSRSPRSNATIRTTTAVTIIGGGVKENALPASARALVNFRILPGDSVAGVLAHVRDAVADPSVAVEVSDTHTALEPSPESRVDSEGFALLSRTIREMQPDVVVAPNLVLGGTDARYFHALSDSVYRFGPLRLDTGDLKRPHGTNERVSAADYLDSVRFYVRLLQNAG